MGNNGLYKTLVDFDDVPEDAFIVDVRNGNEHSDVSLKRKHYFVELPRFDAAEFLKEHRPDGKTIYVLCQSGKRASVAAQRLEEAGYENVAVIRGGMGALSNRSEIVKKRAAVSLERQVRIIAGSLVLAGSVAALVFSPTAALLPAFVGCGLLYAGISDSCAMATLLSKMPWNKRPYR